VPPPREQALVGRRCGRTRWPIAISAEVLAEPLEPRHAAPRAQSSCHAHILAPAIVIARASAASALVFVDELSGVPQFPPNDSCSTFEVDFGDVDLDGDFVARHVAGPRSDLPMSA
jgi:hypothetical protein